MDDDLVNFEDYNNDVGVVNDNTVVVDTDGIELKMDDDTILEKFEDTAKLPDTVITTKMEYVKSLFNKLHSDQPKPNNATDKTPQPAPQKSNSTFNKLAKLKEHFPSFVGDIYVTQTTTDINNKYVAAKMNIIKTLNQIEYGESDESSSLVNDIVKLTSHGEMPFWTAAKQQFGGAYKNLSVDPKGPTDDFVELYKHLSIPKGPTDDFTELYKQYMEMLNESGSGEKVMGYTTTQLNQLPKPKLVSGWPSGDEKVMGYTTTQLNQLPKPKLVSGWPPGDEKLMGYTTTQSNQLPKPKLVSGNTGGPPVAPMGFKGCVGSVSNASLCGCNIHSGTDAPPSFGAVGDDVIKDILAPAWSWSSLKNPSHAIRGPQPNSNGYSGLTGPTGPMRSVGPKGIKGPTGPTGPTGVLSETFGEMYDIIGGNFNVVTALTYFPYGGSLATGITSNIIVFGGPVGFLLIVESGTYQALSTVNFSSDNASHICYFLYNISGIDDITTNTPINISAANETTNVTLNKIYILTAGQNVSIRASCNINGPILTVQTIVVQLIKLK